MGTGTARSGDGIADFRMLTHVLETAGVEVAEAAAGDEAGEATGIQIVGSLKLFRCGCGRQMVNSASATVVPHLQKCPINNVVSGSPFRGHIHGERPRVA